MEVQHEYLRYMAVALALQPKYRFRRQIKQPIRAQEQNYTITGFWGVRCVSVKTSRPQNCWPTLLKITVLTPSTDTADRDFDYDPMSNVREDHACGFETFGESEGSV